MPISIVKEQLLIIYLLPRDCCQAWRVLWGCCNQILIILYTGNLRIWAFPGGGRSRLEYVLSLDSHSLMISWRRTHRVWVCCTVISSRF